MLTIVLTKTGSHFTYGFNEHTRGLHMALTMSYKSFKRAQFRSKAQKKSKLGKSEKPKTSKSKTLLFIKSLHPPLTLPIFEVIRENASRVKILGQCSLGIFFYVNENDTMKMLISQIQGSLLILM